MIPSDDLYVLIKSLGRSEKRYVRQQSTLQVKGGENAYIRLFDIVDRQASFDPELLEKKITATGLTKHLSRTKTYLYRFILKCLRSYYDQKSVDNQIRNLMRNVEVLHSKSLYELAEKQLASCKKMALRYEKFNLLLDILRLQRKLLFGPQSLEATRRIMRQNYREQEEIIARLQNQHFYSSLADDLGYLVNSASGAGKLEKERELKRILKMEEIRNIENAKSFDAKRCFYYINAVSNHHAGNLLKSHLYYSRLIAFVEDHPDLMRENPHSYISACNNFAALCNKLQKRDDFVRVVRKLRLLPDKLFDVISDNTRIRILARTYNLELDLYVHTGEFDKGLRLIEEIEKKALREVTLEKPQELVFWYNSAYICLGSGKFSRAISFLTRILNEEKIDISLNIYSLCCVMMAICHYELGKRDSIAYLYRQYQITLSKKERLFRSERLLLDFIRDRLAVEKTMEDLIPHLKKLKKNIAEALSDPLEAGYLEAFDVISWIDSKLEQKPFSEILQRKAKATAEATASTY